MAVRLTMDVHTQFESRKLEGINRYSTGIYIHSVGVATIQMGDRSAREPMKVVPSRDITLGRRKEPMNQGLPNGTS